MAQTTVRNMRILTRRDTESNWTDFNPVLLIGEMGYETDARGLKFGDGVTPWRQLPYFMGWEGVDGGAPVLNYADNKWPWVNYD